MTTHHNVFKHAHFWKNLNILKRPGNSDGCNGMGFHLIDTGVRKNEYARMWVQEIR